MLSFANFYTKTLAVTSSYYSRRSSLAGLKTFRGSNGEIDPAVRFRFTNDRYERSGLTTEVVTADGEAYNQKAANDFVDRYEPVLVDGKPFVRNHTSGLNIVALRGALPG